MNVLVDATQSMLKNSQSGNFESVEQIADNRERLINIVRLLQDEIESKLQSATTHYTSSEIDVFKSWISDVTEIVKKNDELDRQCLEELSQAKESTTREISNVYKTRKQFQGYNLNNTKTR
ncbi:hypothetical protein [Halobacteriovorax sp. YZS-1-1]|uniref:hypothetical protein n=1 Tax=unclassified Halobacteriovorax TaxID=2639665 RepID=UPI003999FF95